MSATQSQPATDSSLRRLLEECQAQLRNFIQRTAARDESPSCNAIVGHAASGNEAALGMLSELIIPLIRQRCSRDQRIDVDDTIQDVSIRLVRRFRNQANPYIPTTFAAFRSYLNLTIRSVVLNTIERDRQPNTSLETVREKEGIEPKQPSAAPEVEERILLDDLLALLPDPLERESLRRRYLYQETPAEIAEALRATDPAITKAHVYRYVERGMRRLVSHPLVQKLGEEE